MAKGNFSIVRRGMAERRGRGFSTAELAEVGISVGEARRLGVPVDVRRRTSHEGVVEGLREYVEGAKRRGVRLPKPRGTTKRPAGRARRGLTSAGKKMRGLRRR